MKHPLRDLSVLIHLYLLIIHLIKKTNMKNWKTSLFGALTAICAFCAMQNVYPPLTDVFKAVGTLSFALGSFFAADAIPAVVKTIAIIIGMSLSAISVNAQGGVPNGPAGQINVNPIGNGAPGNVGDIQISFNGIKAAVSGFNYNAATNVLIADSIPLGQAMQTFSADTTVTDTILVTANTVNVGVGMKANTLKYVIVLPYWYLKNGLFAKITFNKTVQSVTVIYQTQPLSNRSSVSNVVLYTGVGFTLGNPLEFFENNGTWY